MSVLFIFALFQSYAWAQLDNGPLLPPTTSFAVETSTSVIIKHTTCYITNGIVSECRRKRGVQEKPEIIQFAESNIIPSEVHKIEITAVPRIFRSTLSNSAALSGSIQELDSNSLLDFRKLDAKFRDRSFTVRNCGDTAINFRQLLTCMGFIVQETSTLTATLTVTTTVITGFKTFMVAGCTPAGFPFVTCSPSSLSVNPEEKTIPEEILKEIEETPAEAPAEKPTEIPEEKPKETSEISVVKADPNPEVITELITDESNTTEVPNSSNEELNIEITEPNPGEVDARTEVNTEIPGVNLENEKLSIETEINAVNAFNEEACTASPAQNDIAPSIQEEPTTKPSTRIRRLIKKRKVCRENC